jgi:hypothetical protein
VWFSLGSVFFWDLGFDVDDLNIILCKDAGVAVCYVMIPNCLLVLFDSTFLSH